MRLLLDTHAFLWAAAHSEQLSKKARSAIEDRANDVFVSAAVAWEIVQKHSIGKLALPAAPEQWFTMQMQTRGFSALAISVDHALALRSLPLHHRDPLDRIMIAQAQIEDLVFVTRDIENRKYPIQVLPA